MTRATRDQVIEAFDAVIAERGEDWVYPQLTGDEILDDVTDDWHVEGVCRYVKPDGGYACVWGGVFHKIDPTVPLAYTTDGINTVLHQITGEESRPFREAASWSQIAQDRGMPYGQVKEGFHRILAMTSDELSDFGYEEDLALAGYPDPVN